MSARNANLSQTSHALQRHLQGRVHWRAIALRLVIGGGLVAAAVWFGRHAGEDIKAMEAWIAGLGFWGPVAYIGALIILTSLLFPGSLLEIAAGGLFGLIWGTVFAAVAVIITASLNYLTAQRLLRARIHKMLERHPKLAAIERAATREGLRLQVLLRLAPLSPVSVSYVLGAAGVKYSTFMLATAALLPGLFINVYFGHLAGHATRVAGRVSSHSTLHTVVIVAGFVVCIALMILAARMASKALGQIENENPADMQSTPA